MSRRASLPGADELFRPTGDKSTRRQEDKSTNLQVAAEKTPRHEAKVTFYCTNADLTDLESARLQLRTDHAIGADRGKVVRTALAYVLEDFAARGGDSVLVRRLQDGEG